MQSLAFVMALLAMVGMVVAPPPDKPFHCPGPGLWPDPEDCQCFYDCANDLPYHDCCGDGTVFDPVFHICNYPYLVDCDDIPPKPTTRPPTTTPATTTTATTTTATTTRSTTTLVMTTRTTTTATTTKSPDTTEISGCDYFTEEACNLVESNIMGSDSDTDTPGACQDLCLAEPACSWFTHFGSQCYLLADCGPVSRCDGCVSGPPSPDFDSCPWPPVPTTSAPPTTTTTTTTTTTPPPTTTTTTATTTTTSPTTTTTTTTTVEPGCADFTLTACDLSETNLVSRRPHTASAGECQAICGEEPAGACHWFTYFDTMCFLLVTCGEEAKCEGCISGPTSPALEACSPAA